MSGEAVGEELNPGPGLAGAGGAIVAIMGLQGKTLSRVTWYAAHAARRGHGALVLSGPRWRLSPPHNHVIGSGGLFVTAKNMKLVPCSRQRTPCPFVLHLSSRCDGGSWLRDPTTRASAETSGVEGCSRWRLGLGAVWGFCIA